MTLNPNFQLSQIGQIAMPVADLGRAVAFYRDKLGLPHLFTVSQLAFFDCAGLRLMLSRPEALEFTPPGSILYFRVANIEVAYQALLGRGVTFEAEPHLIAKMETHDLWMAFFRDPEGNLLALMSEVTS